MKAQNSRNVVKSANAIDASRTNFKPENPVDLICSLFEKALNSKRPVVKSKYAVDPVNAYVESNFNIKVSSDDPKHPLDEFYDSVKLELSNRRPFVKPNRPLDVANALGNIAHNGFSIESSQKIEKIFNSIKELYRSSVKSSCSVDPVNDLVEGLSEPVHFFGEPKNSEEEVIALIKKSLGPAYRSIKPSFATDMVNDAVAKQFDLDLPSAEAIPLVFDKLFEATNELAYKLTPGSEEYNNKAKEIDKLKDTLKKLRANLKDLDN